MATLPTLAAAVLGTVFIAEIVAFAVLKRGGRPAGLV